VSYLDFFYFYAFGSTYLIFCSTSNTVSIHKSFQEWMKNTMKLKKIKRELCNQYFRSTFIILTNITIILINNSHNPTIIIHNAVYILCYNSKYYFRSANYGVMKFYHVLYFSNSWKYGTYCWLLNGQCVCFFRKSLSSLLTTALCLSGRVCVYAMVPDSDLSGSAGRRWLSHGLLHCRLAALTHSLPFLRSTA